MGINDRDYYRREGPSIYGSPDDQGKACTWLIGITVLLFVAQLLTRVQAGRGAWLPGPFTDALSLDVPQVWNGQVWRLITYAFLHGTGGFMHILFNMLGLWWFGRQVEERIGTREFIALYLAAAAFSGLAYMAAAAAGFHPPGVVVGASGAVAAVLILSAIYYPQQVVYLFFVIPVPIWFIVLLMIASDGYSLLARVPSGVASAAHLGGLFFGFVYDRLSLRLTALVPSWVFKPRPRLRLYAPEEPEEQRRPSRLSDEHLEAQLDAILEKVGRVGMGGLTEKERQLLIKASEAIRRREE